MDWPIRKPKTLRVGKEVGDKSVIKEDKTIESKYCHSSRRKKYYILLTPLSNSCSQSYFR